MYIKDPIQISISFIILVLLMVLHAVCREKKLRALRMENETLQKELAAKNSSATSLVNDLNKFKMAVDNVSDQIIITDPEGVVLYGNKAMERTTGYKVEEAIGKKAGVLWKTPMPHEYYVRMWNVIKQEKKTFVDEVQNKRKGGEIYTAKIAISPVLNEKGEILYFVGIERDITQEKEVDKAKTEFVSLASHQLRTPLSAVNWYTEMLLTGDAGKLTPKQQKYLTEVYTGNQRMVTLVNALLNVSRLDLGTFIIEPEKVDVIVITKSVLAELRPLLLRKKTIIEEEYKEGIPEFLADPNLLRSIIQNLLSNAVKYSPPESVVHLSWSVVRKHELFGGKKMFKDTLAFSVTDSGIGIPKKQQSKIFTKLFRADNAAGSESEGTGLGLYVVKTVVDESGGSVWLQSEEKKGSVFYVTFPLIGMKKKTGSKN